MGPLRATMDNFPEPDFSRVSLDLFYEWPVISPCSTPPSRNTSMLTVESCLAGQLITVVG